ncbi:MAG: DUF1501 domain-containing protein, partial [Planctomycetes bacterium]|nr:DUF1501 domain-containing protein [Planctomycetota bacterium]
LSVEVKGVRMDRRSFLRILGSAACVRVLSPTLCLWADEGDAVRGAARWDRVLVLIELQGGNDGLNTVIPIRNETYFALRPRLAIAKEDALPLEGDLALHPALKPLEAAWNDKECAIALGLGYEAPNRSHFRSIEIWETASASDEYLDSGWIGRAFAPAQPPREHAASGIVIGRGTEGPLAGPGMRNVMLNDPEVFARQARRQKPLPEHGGYEALDHLLEVRNELRRAAEVIAEKARTAPPLGAAFPRTPFGRQLETAAELLVCGVPVAVIKVALGSFDTHSNQAGTHQRLLGELAQGIAALRAALAGAKLWERTLVVTYSEFGRRAAENGSGGTDHGTAAPHFLIGGKVKGGIYGAYPDLERLEGGDLRHTLDFRSLYATVLQEWWHLAAPAELAAHRPLACLRR